MKSDTITLLSEDGHALVTTPLPPYKIVREQPATLAMEDRHYMAPFYGTPAITDPAEALVRMSGLDDLYPADCFVN